MFKWLKGFLTSLAEPKQDVIKSSITGKPLVIVTGGFGHGFSLKQTDIGLQGCLISFRITQLGDNRQTILDLFNGEFDDYLSKSDKERLIEHIKHRYERGGYYLETKRNSQGDLDIVSIAWDNEFKTKLGKLLEELW
ncbi:hypothetical protein JR318_gp213 [Escherichia phage vB_vPM_PD06]|uniref:Uncharacterized protein n=2 Tax=Justusliebigvirus TaxID=2948775 RepID=A0A386KL30_9CAUD|nr:hypothetical protein JR318_gp213 [Escherichia phage vB_vPM_PD06]YP_009985257.1 hypothetical protein JR320_gp154 [Escherichia phage alia]AMM43368.1 hypothetical protein ECGD1_042 [Enterobacteria phage ECGD1]AXY81391.1 hypothetical protein [Escherichia phage vB_vPM_PD114]UGL62265.1 hypothetical protein JLBYU50_4 [Escherichia phage JLBYU50]UIS31399.1 hypothetical protein UAB1_gp028 [Salmonella phage UAB_1]UVF09937.1 hypothetical protein [Escherichia phage pEC-M2929-1AR.1]HAZ7467382.1 hypothe